MDEEKDPDLIEAIEEIGIREFNSLMDDEALHLERVIEILDDERDPKGDKVLHYLGKEGWRELVHYFLAPFQV